MGNAQPQIARPDLPPAQPPPHAGASAKPRFGLLGRWTWQVLRVYLIVLLILMLFENFLIFPAPKYPAGRWQPQGIQVEDAYFTAEDGTRLHGWFVDHPQPLAYVLFCHGNAEHLGYMDWFLADLHQLDIAVFAFDYRGYGRSEGSPNEAGLLADGRAAQAWLARRAKISPSDIVVMGRSVGGAVAVDLAASHGARGLVVENTFTSIPDVAAEHYWWAPARWLIRTRFDSETKIRDYRGPLLQSHGTADRIVSVELAKRLFAACPSSNKQFFAIPGGDHNDLPPPEYYEALAQFFKQLPGR